MILLLKSAFFWASTNKIKTSNAISLLIQINTCVGIFFLMLNKYLLINWYQWKSRKNKESTEENHAVSMLMQKKKEKKKRIMCCCLLGDPSEKIYVQRKQKDANIKEVPSPIIGQMYNKFNYAARGHCHPGFTTQWGKNNWHQPIRSCCCLLLTN